MEINLFNGDCLLESDKIESDSVDLILTDLPYGILQPNHKGIAYKKRFKNTVKWDTKISPISIFSIANRILRKNGKAVFFSQEPYTSELISSAISNLCFSYKLIWIKNTFGNHLKVNNSPSNFFEEILIFTKKNEKEDTNLANPLRVILKKYIDKYGRKYIENLFYSEGRYSSIESAKVHANFKFGFKDNKRFDLIDKKMFSYLDKYLNFEEKYEDIVKIYSSYNDNILQLKNKKYPNIFNLWEGTKHKSNVLNYKKDGNMHPTQKPVLLLEDLIKTFSNENDLVVDLTMGSGSTGVACKNTNRNFVGIELDEKYFKIAEERINKPSQGSLF